ncbi:MAG: DNA methyltransferase [Phenylobacterium sp.]|uniref:site-specific DNA-methyltransferase n=1 Tax=Phenylobacterium sp. TaxID=1871053 RepID=UPI00273369D5|nr:DNA methyltransferase [Phenylobacterium sp.]MDP3176111.1 DNA methyltransferase [Phenylobacterium sp.]
MSRPIQDIERLSLAIEHRPLTSIKPNPANVRRHTTKQIAKLARAIHEFGFAVPLVIDEADIIMTGHARFAAAKQLKFATVPCIALTHLTPEQKTAFAIADNKLHDESDFDPDALSAVLSHLLSVEYDIEITGFETPEVDMLLDVGGRVTTTDPADQFDEPGDKPAVTRPGDLWRLDGHRLLCADALRKESFARLLGGDLAQMVISDCPYNVAISGHVSGLGSVRHREFAMASGEMSREEFIVFLTTATTNMAEASVDGSIHALFMDWRHLGDLLVACEGVYAELKNICIWAKTNAGMGSLYRSQHEMVPVFKKGKAPHINNVELGKHGRYRTNLWSYAGANSFSATRDADLAAHPTVKPVGLIADAIKDCSKRGGIILDPFAGSGTILLACERTGRRAAAMEIDPLYVDVAIARWQRLTGNHAVLDGDGRTFADIAQERLAGAAAPNSEGAA